MESTKRVMLIRVSGILTRGAFRVGAGVFGELFRDGARGGVFGWEDGHDEICMDMPFRKLSY